MICFCMLGKTEKTVFVTKNRDKSLFLQKKGEQDRLSHRVKCEASANPIADHTAHEA